MVNITSWFLTFHPHCIRVDPRPWRRNLDGSTSHTQKLFKSIPHPKTCFFFFLAPLYHQRKWCSLAGVIAGRNVWLSVCVLVAWTCPYQPSPQEMTGRSLWSPSRVFSLFLLSPETQGGRPPPPPRTLLMLCTHPPLLSTQSLATKCLLECRTSDY